MDTPYRTIQEVAFLLNTTTRNVHRLLADGKIPHTRYRRRVIIKMGDLLSYLAGVLSRITFIAHPGVFLCACQIKSPPVVSLRRSHASQNNSKV